MTENKEEAPKQEKVEDQSIEKKEEAPQVKEQVESSNNK